MAPEAIDCQESAVMAWLGVNDPYWWMLVETGWIAPGTIPLPLPQDIVEVRRF